MPGKECEPADERLRFITRLLEGEKMAPVCREFGISRVTGYKIFERYKANGTPLSAARAPNGPWCADYKGEFLLGNQQYCYPLTITDYRSRDLLACEGLESTKSRFACSVFERTFRSRIPQTWSQVWPQGAQRFPSFFLSFFPSLRLSAVLLTASSALSSGPVVVCLSTKSPTAPVLSSALLVVFRTCCLTTVLPIPILILLAASLRLPRWRGPRR
jgi:Homeodomain-like domain